MNEKEILADIATYEHRLKNPGGLSDQQLQVYRNSLNAARAALAQVQGQSKQQTHQQPPRTTTATRREMPSAAQKAPAEQQRYQQNQEPTQSAAMRTVVVNLPGAGLPQVKIEWADKEAEIVTEGLALSRFKTCLRDLANSEKYQQERYSQLPTYRAWHRAAGYYQALTEFWLYPPSAEDLQMSKATAYRHLFNLIQQYTAA